MREWCAATALAGVFFSCGSSPESEFADGGRIITGGGSSGVIHGGSDNGGTGGGANGNATGDAGCVSDIRRAIPTPLDIYILFDQSGSMTTAAGSGTRLDAVRSAASDFLGAPESAGLGVGIGYFGNFPIGQTSCNPADYQTPAVGIGTLPDQATLLLDSLASIAPIGETPTGAALRGATTYLTGWKTLHPDHAVALLLLTDGVPEAPVSSAKGCNPTLADAVTAAQTCVATTGASIYVLGVGPNLANLNSIAAAGGTANAYLVDSAGANVAGDVLLALNTIRGTALPCGFAIPAPPSGKTLNFDEVNVVVTDKSGNETSVYRVPSAADCDANRGGWYYEPAGAPTQISLCDASCQFVKAQAPSGAIAFTLGCQSVSLPPR